MTEALAARQAEIAALTAYEAEIKAALDAGDLPTELADAGAALGFGAGVEGLRRLHGAVGAELGRARLSVLALEAANA